MKRISLTARLTTMLASFSFFALIMMGGALYFALEHQLTLRDDAALVSRVDQISTLLKDLDARKLINEKPHLFANMLGNTESLLIIRYVNGPTLLQVNPLEREIPTVKPVPEGQRLTLAAVHHSAMPDGTPLIYMAKMSPSSGGLMPLEIISARILTDRARVLQMYRNNIILFAAMMAVVSGGLAYLFARRGVSPLHRLANRMNDISTRTLSSRLANDDAPRELDLLIEQVNAMLERLENGFEQLKQVSADMAHDLRTPITVLLGQTEVGLSMPRDDAYYHRLLGSNFEELQRLSRMIDNMLFLAQAEQPGLVINRAKLDVATSMKQISDYFEDLAAEKNIRINTVGQGGTVYADSLLFRRALANLLSNAVKHAVPASEIILSASPFPGGISVNVTNRGEAIPQQQQEKIFDRFYRADPSRHNSAEASGLGLAIVRSIMQLHQGTCRVGSEYGTTTFGLCFPDAPTTDRNV
ncbi:heavy metal sensor histidine kinase [Serratia sp. Nf2]|uniref:heavy metal sensor histidine kinase n=1 Tax=Serratia sp. Nf2 TaxID=2116540 RepID=UPI000D15F33C|nr:heavy metal sensor histidine kinase [Serratia sp. Nf2]PTA73970.1 two-component sensor histidine kinase [Serratia sp. Nf2]